MWNFNNDNESVEAYLLLALINLGLLLSILLG